MEFMKNKKETLYEHHEVEIKKKNKKITLKKYMMNTTFAKSSFDNGNYIC